MIDPALDTFYLDSGASVHISNIESNFYTLRPIIPYAINGWAALPSLLLG